MALVEKVFGFYKLAVGTDTAREIVESYTGYYDADNVEPDSRPVANLHYDPAVYGWVVLDSLEETAAEEGAATTVLQERYQTVNVTTKVITPGTRNAPLRERQQRTAVALADRREGLRRLLHLGSRIRTQDFDDVFDRVKRMNSVETTFASWGTAPEGVLSDPLFAEPDYTLEADALVKRAPALFNGGSIARRTLADGLGRNLIRNSDFSQGLTGWTMSDQGTLDGDVTLTLREGTTFTGSNYPVLALNQPNADASVDKSLDYAQATFQKALRNGTMDNRSIGVEELKWYEWSPQLCILRCDARLAVVWYDSTGLSVGTTSQADITSAAGGSQTNPNLWPRHFYKMQAPAGAAFGRPYVRKFGTKSGTDSYVFVHKPFFAETHEDATGPAPYNDGPAGFGVGRGLITDSLSKIGHDYDEGSVAITALSVADDPGSAALAALTTLSTFQIDVEDSDRMFLIWAAGEIAPSAGTDNVNVDIFVSFFWGAGTQDWVDRRIDMGFPGTNLPRRQYSFVCPIVAAIPNSTLTVRVCAGKGGGHSGGNPLAHNRGLIIMQLAA